MTRWRRFFALEAAQRRVFLASLVLLPCTSVLLRLRGYAVAQRLAAYFPALCCPDLSPAVTARMVDAAGSLSGASCLPRSLVLWGLLRARGAVIRLGVAQSPPKGIAAHAWVELDGCPINDAPDVTERYAVLGA